MGMAGAAPGNDPRTWVSIARVDDHDDAITWDDSLGWIVDVTFLGGPLDQDGPVPCRLGSMFVGRSDPPNRGCLVVVVIPGSTNEECVVVGVLSAEDCPQPLEVNGETIDEDFAKRTHFLVTTKNVDEQIDGEIRSKSSGDHRILSDGQVLLATQDPSQSFVRGEDFESAINDFASSVQSFASSVSMTIAALAPPGPPGTPVTGVQVVAAIGVIGPAVIAISSAVASLSIAAVEYKSTRIKGE